MAILKILGKLDCKKYQRLAKTKMGTVSIIYRRPGISSHHPDITETGREQEPVTLNIEGNKTTFTIPWADPWR